MTSSIKPQLFIDLGHLSLTEVQIKQALESQFKLTDASIVLKQSHDKLKLNCAIALQDQQIAEKLLSGGATLQVGGSNLKLEAYQAQYPNVFLKNEGNALSSEEIEAEVKEIVKGPFQIYYGAKQVSLHIADEAELAKIIGVKRTVKDKSFTFEKYISINRSNAGGKNSSNSNSNNSNGSSAFPTNPGHHLFIKFNEINASQLESSLQTLKEYIQNSFGPVSEFERKGSKQDQITLSVIFVQQEHAQKLFDFIQANSHSFFDQKNVSVNWKLSDQVDLAEKNNRTLYFKFLHAHITDKDIREAIEPFGPIEKVQLLNFPTRSNAIDAQNPNHTSQTRAAYVTLSSSEQCTNLMSDAKKHQLIKGLFTKFISIAPYVSKADFSNLQQINEKTKKTLVNKGHEFSTASQLGGAPNQQLQQQLPQQLPHNPLIPQQQQQLIYVNQQNQFQFPPQYGHPQQYYQMQQQQHPINYQQYPPHQHHKNNGQRYNNGGNNYNNYQKPYKNRNYNHQYQQQQQFQVQQQPIYVQSYPNQIPATLPAVSGWEIQQQQQAQMQQFLLSQQQIQPLPVLHQPIQPQDVFAQQILPTNVAQPPQFGLTQEEMKKKFSETNDENVYLSTLRDLTRKDLTNQFPDHVDKFDQIMELLLDDEVLSHEDRIDIIFDPTELSSRVKEGITLILEENQDE